MIDAADVADPSVDSQVREDLSGRDLKFCGCALVVVVLAALLFFAGLGAPSLWGPEGRWGSIAREMQLSGNYFWPTINGRLYYDKPLLTYWLIVAASFVTGDVHEFTIRLPGAIAGLLGVALVVLLARRLYDRRTALFSGCIMATCFGYVFWTRVASADIETVTGVLAAITYYWYRREDSNTWWTMGLWLIMALTSLTKGLLGFALPLLVIGVASLVSDGWRDLAAGIFRGRWLLRVAWLKARMGWFFNWKSIIGLGVAALVYYLPFAVSGSLMKSDAGVAAVLRENIQRFFEPFDHQDPFYMYAFWIWRLMAPWSVFLPAMITQMIVTPKGRNDRFVLTYFWAIYIFFTLSGSRRYYYLLPILPAAAILTARLFTTPRELIDRRVRYLINGGFALLAMATFVFGIAALFPSSWRFGPWRSLPELPNPMLFGAIWLAQIVALAVAVKNSSIVDIGRSACVIAFISLFYIFIWFNPLAMMDHGEKAFAQAVRTRLQGDMSGVAIFAVHGPGLVYYLAAKEPMPEFFDVRSLQQHAESRGALWIISLEEKLRLLPWGGQIVEREDRFSPRNSLRRPRGLVLFHVPKKAKVD